MLVDLRGLFTPQAVKQILKGLPVIKTGVMDAIFPDRPQLALPVVGIEDLVEVVNTVPVVRRGAPSLPIGSETAAFTFVEPLPISIRRQITGQDLNNLKMIWGDKASLQAWVTDKTDYLRRVARKTTEGICTQSLTGKVEWPCQLEHGGFSTYEVDYGVSPLSVTPATLWDASGATVMTVYDSLNAAEEAIQDEGYGSQVEFWAGKKAFRTLLGLIDAHKSTAKMRVELKEGAVDVGGYTVTRMTERYRNPQAGTMHAKVPDHQVLAYAKDAGSRLFYCALDDLDAKLQALPFYVKPLPMNGDPAGWRLIGQSKPLPAPVLKALCWMAVTAA